MNALCPVEEITVENIRIPDDDDDLQAVGGIYTIVKESARMFTMGSHSRGIPYKQWGIPLPGAVESYGFCPDADVIAFIELREVMCVYQLYGLLL